MLRKFSKRKENLRIIISEGKIRDREVHHRNLEVHQKDRERKDINHSIKRMIQVMIQNLDIRREGIEEEGIIIVKSRIKVIEILHPAVKGIDFTVKQIMQRTGIIKTLIRTPPDS